MLRIQTLLISINVIARESFISILTHPKAHQSWINGYMGNKILILFLPSLLSKIRFYFPPRFKKKNFFYLFNFFIVLFSAVVRILLLSRLFFPHILTHIGLFLNPHWLGDFQRIPFVAKALMSAFSRLSLWPDMASSMLLPVALPSSIYQVFIYYLQTNIQRVYHVLSIML